MRTHKIPKTVGTHKIPKTVGTHKIPKVVPPTVQIVGAFNSGTNVVIKLIKSLFNVTLHPEGHTLFWKHTRPTLELVTKQPKKVLYIVVVKHPLFWFHSIHKKPYAMSTAKLASELSTIAYIKQSVALLNETYYDFVDYYNQFYNSCRANLPSEQTVFINYTDLLTQPMNVIEQLSACLPYHTRICTDQKAIAKVITTVLARPAKSHGQPRYGGEAARWYAAANLSKLFNVPDSQWINERLDQNLIRFLGY